MKNYDIFDLTKIVLCIMVIAIHTQLFPKILYPWLRLAVPIFFLISSYLLYSKVNQSAKELKKQIICRYIVRLMKLYVFWFVVLLPITLYVRKDWFINGIVSGILLMIIKFFTGSTFIASWYISASIFGTLIVDFITNRIHNYKLLLVLFVVIYFGCCFTSSYIFLFKNININSLFKIFQPHTSFFVGLIYIFLGKLMSDNKIKINKKINIIAIIFFAILLYIEWFLLFKISGIYNNDCYFMLLPLAFLIFNYIKNITICIDNSKIFRQFSNFSYPLHASFARLLNPVLAAFISHNIISSFLSFIITVLVCVMLFWMVKKLECKFKLLKYSY